MFDNRNNVNPKLNEKQVYKLHGDRVNMTKKNQRLTLNAKKNGAITFF